MDTSTVRLVIFLGMFLIFAGDYSALISTLFGKASDGNATDAVKEPSEADLKNGVSIISKKDANKDNGKDGVWKYRVKTRENATSSFFANMKLRKSNILY